MIQLYKPELKDLWYRRQFLSDEDTMSYNLAWGGTIDFTQDKWERWYELWLSDQENKHFYRYLKNSNTADFLGEIAYYFEEERSIWLSDILIEARYRRRGYGRKGLRLLCEAALERGITILSDEIAIDNPAIKLFFDEGFIEKSRTKESILLVKKLK